MAATFKVLLSKDSKAAFCSQTDAYLVPCLPGLSLAKSIYLSGLFAPLPFCSGLGQCGLCKVKFLRDAPQSVDLEKNILSAQELEAGWRLSCKHAAAAGMFVELPGYVKLNSAHDGIINVSEREEVFLAVDLGTTSIQWQAIAQSGSRVKVLDEGRQINPQMGAGSEVMSRLHEAAGDGGLQRLSGLVLSALCDIVGRFSIPPKKVCLAANTAMTAILLKKDISSLALAPYALPLEGDAEFSLPGLPPVYIPPLFAPFVGGDISAGLTAVLMGKCGNEPVFPFLLADLGTNGEFILAKTPQEFYAASIPLGPALEGIGLACGGAAGVGAGGAKPVTAFGLSAEGIAGKNVLLNDAESISGTGYLSLLSILVKNKILNKDGTFVASTDVVEFPLTKRLRDRLEYTAKGAIFHLGRDIYLTAQDVEEMLKVKAAFSLACKQLLKRAGLSVDDLERIYLAGALGEHVCVEDLEMLGFLPLGFGRKVDAAGNTSLCGAGLFLTDQRARSVAADCKGRTLLLPLQDEPCFMDYYMSEMKFSW